MNWDWLDNWDFGRGAEFNLVPRDVIGAIGGAGGAGMSTGRLAP